MRRGTIQMLWALAALMVVIHRAAAEGVLLAADRGEGFRPSGLLP